MAAVIPTAKRTDSVLYVIDAIPNRIPSNIVNRNRHIKFPGVFLLTPSQQARTIMRIIVPMEASQNNQML